MTAPAPTSESRAPGKLRVALRLQWGPAHLPPQTTRTLAEPCCEPGTASGCGCGSRTGRPSLCPREARPRGPQMRVQGLGPACWARSRGGGGGEAHCVRSKQKLLQWQGTGNREAGAAWWLAGPHCRAPRARRGSHTSLLKAKEAFWGFLSGKQHSLASPGDLARLCWSRSLEGGLGGCELAARPLGPTGRDSQTPDDPRGQDSLFPASRIHSPQARPAQPLTHVSPRTHRTGRQEP